jgi:HEAT repeats
MGETRRLWLAGVALAFGFAWPGQAERLVGELTAAATPRDKRDALRLLTQLGEPFARESVLPFVRDADPGVRADALRLLADPALLEAAAHDSAPEVRRLALSLVQDVPTLLAGLDDGDPQVNLVALRALASVPAANVLRALLGELDDDAIEVRIEAARVLGTRAEPEARDALLALVDTPLPELRAAAIDALASEPRVLRRALSDRDPGVLLAVLRGYARNPQLPRADLQPLATSPTLPQIASGARALLAEPRAALDPAWLAPLERSAGPEGQDPRRAAALLAELERSLDSDLATAPLLEWLPRAPFFLAPRIVALIERAGGEVSAANVQPWLAADPARRALALRLLARSPSSAELRHAVEHDSSASVRAAAAEALAHKDVPALAAAYPGIPLRALASTTLPPSHRLVTALLRDVREGDAERASQALRALGPLDDAQARAAILRALDEPALVLAALRASVYDRSALARSKRRALHHAPLGHVASTALTASLLAGDPLEPVWLRDTLQGAPWPLAEVAAFALAYEPARSQPELQTYAASSFFPAQRHVQPRALRTTHGLLLISWPDATGRVDWPALRVVEDVTAWPPQSRERK